MNNKIDIRDMRVGNWVEFNKTIHQIKATDFVKLKKESIECNPISLTKEILEKNFKYSVYNKYGQIRHDVEDINRRLYVACSICKNKLYLKFGN